MVAVLGGIGWLPATATGEVLPKAVRAAAGGPADAGMALSGAVVPPRLPSRTVGRSAAEPAQDSSLPAPPADSGEGRRVVFDMSDQRVWLVDSSPRGGDVVVRTYLVSGSVTDNLRPDTYAVYSRSRHAWGIDDSGTMQYFVRFAHGPHAAIGFHDIPVKDGVPLQSRAELGTPQSHGCIRQWRPDARALWRFAPVGSTVVVVA